MTELSGVPVQHAVIAVASCHCLLAAAAVHVPQSMKATMMTFCDNFCKIPRRKRILNCKNIT